ncbi:hypothetical protein GCM10010873_17250 [Cypionkella aquatica]|uniref:histidine kinase n=1 Tax=Cypionkella aquatica TaxID=1756042 RepID=A0AA37X3G1_9RHOB|nr:response regulator [Cypionkella aquatica]GLS86751.1 hypothetical protein GCM10010873_17250 [Cypionkella aquatica]
MHSPSPDRSATAPPTPDRGDGQISGHESGITAGITAGISSGTPYPQTPPADITLLGHDLRAALSEVIGGLRLIDPHQLPSEPRLHIARTRAASEALALLMEQALVLLLDDPQSRAPSLQTHALLQSLQLRWTARAHQLGLEFQLHATDLPAELALDGVVVERVLSNLLNNAIKYADTGCISCDLRLVEQSGPALQITVQDQGKGFSADTLSRLYSCGNRGEHHNTPGSGMGLHIVWQMVTHAGGGISASNHAKGGAQIVVHLPLASATAFPPQPQTAKPMKPNLQVLANLRLLVADDSETGRLVLAHQLTSQGASVTTVADGQQAIQALQQQSFDALLIDIEMPQMNGLEVIGHIRSSAGAQAKLPVLAITAYQLRANKTAILAAGADGLLCKPVLDAQALADAVRQVLHRNAPAQNLAPQIEPAQLQQLLSMAGPAVAAELLEHLLQDLRATERGLLAASHGPDWTTLRRHTHVMIALAGTAGATQLHQLAQALNQLAHQPAPDRGTFRTLLPQALEQLDALIHFIGQQIPNAPQPCPLSSPRAPW